MSSWVSTTACRSGLHFTAAAGNRITGFHSPPVIGVAAMSLEKSCTSARICIRLRIASACRRNAGSRSGRAARTSARRRMAPTATEISEIAQPSAQTMKRTLTGPGEDRVGWPTAAGPGTAPGLGTPELRASGITRGVTVPAASTEAPTGAAAAGSAAAGASTAGGWSSPPRAGRTGTFQEGARMPSRGNTSTRANVAVHS